MKRFKSLNCMEFIQWSLVFLGYAHSDIWLRKRLAHEDHGKREGECHAHLEDEDVGVWEHDLKCVLSAEDEWPVVQESLDGEPVLHAVLRSCDRCDDVVDSAVVDFRGFSRCS